MSQRASVAPVAPLCHLRKWASPSSRLKLYLTPLASPEDPGRHIPSFHHSPRGREGVLRNPSTMPSLAAPPSGPIRRSSPIKDSSTHSIDGETEAPSGASYCLSLTKCLGQGLGKQPMLNQCQLQLLSQSLDTSVLFGAIPEHAISTLPWSNTQLSL